MKKVLLLISGILLVHLSRAQTDTNIQVYDRFGNIYTAEEIEIKPGARANACDAGIFRLDFSDLPDQGFNDFDSGAVRRAVACQVFSDISALIVPANNPYTGTLTTPLVEIEVFISIFI